MRLDALPHDIPCFLVTRIGHHQLFEERSSAGERVIARDYSGAMLSRLLFGQSLCLSSFGQSLSLVRRPTSSTSYSLGDDSTLDQEISICGCSSLMATDSTALVCVRSTPLCWPKEKQGNADQENSIPRQVRSLHFSRLQLRFLS